jgi:hypothetical protein
MLAPSICSLLLEKIEGAAAKPNNLASYRTFLGALRIVQWQKIQLSCERDLHRAT